MQTCPNSCLPEITFDDLLDGIRDGTLIVERNRLGDQIILDKSGHIILAPEYEVDFIPELN